MKLAYTSTVARGDIDLLMHGVADTLMARGHRVCGAVQVNTEGCGDGPCDMDIRILPDGPEFRISQSLGSGSRGCRLDPAALESAVGHVSARLNAGADVLMINKFGKQEAAGQGFRSVIAEAALRGIPVLVGLNALNRQAFLDFADGCALGLAPEPAALLDWLESAVSARSDAA